MIFYSETSDSKMGRFCLIPSPIFLSVFQQAKGTSVEHTLHMRSVAVRVDVTVKP